MRKNLLLLAFSLVIVLTACQSDMNTPSSITGAISYRDNSQIPSSSTIIIRLLDMTNGGDVIKEMQFEAGKSEVPFPFSLEYQKTEIKEENKYALEAEIEFSGTNLYYSLEPFEVFSNGLSNNIALILVKGPKQNQ